MEFAVHLGGLLRGSPVYSHVSRARAVDEEVHVFEHPEAKHH